jgi:aspartate aminotransferase
MGDGFQIDNYIFAVLSFILYNMPTVSDRGRLMPNSPIRKLAPLAQKAKDRGTKVYHLNIGQPDLPTPPEALAAIKAIDRTILEYSPSEGILSFRQKLVKYYHKFNIDVTVDDIIITTGGSEAVTFAFMSCLDPGDEIIVPEPAYANYEAFAIVAGAKIKSLAANIEEGFALPSIEEFEKLITPKTKGIMICNPNNPTGYLYTQQEMNAIRDLVKKYDLYLFSDEVYREFCYTGAPYISAFHLKGIEQNVVLIDSVSKRYSECGLRIGALITKNEEVKKNVMKFCQARLSPPLIGQIAAEASLDADPDYMLNNYNEYVNRRKFLIDGLNRIDGVYSPIPMGAFYTVARLPVDNSDRFCEWLLSDFEYEGQTIFMAPGTGFYTVPNRGLDEVRIAYVLKKEDLAVCLKILEEALKVYPGSKVRQKVEAKVSGSEY